MTAPATEKAAPIPAEMLREFVQFVKHAPVSSGTCCCGDEMDRHSDPMSCGHSPVDMWDHALDGWLKQIEPLLADRASQEERIREDERLRFEGDLDRWMKTLGAGITGYQPEAYAVIDAACAELVRAREAAAALEAEASEGERMREAIKAARWYVEVYDTPEHNPEQAETLAMLDAALTPAPAREGE